MAGTRLPPDVSVRRCCARPGGMSNGSCRGAGVREGGGAGVRGGGGGGGGGCGGSELFTSAPPHVRTSARPHVRTSAPPHLRTPRRPHPRTSAPLCATLRGDPEEDWDERETEAPGRAG